MKNPMLTASEQIVIEVHNCKKYICENTECFDPSENNSLFEMICILVSQRDNAYNEAETYKKQLQSS